MFKNSKGKKNQKKELDQKILQLEKQQLQTKDFGTNTQSEHCLLEYGESELIEVQKKPNTDLSDHNSFVKNSPEQIMKLWGKKKPMGWKLKTNASEANEGYVTSLMTQSRRMSRRFIGVDKKSLQDSAMQRIDEQFAPSSQSEDERAEASRKPRRIKL